MRPDLLFSHDQLISATGRHREENTTRWASAGDGPRGVMGNELRAKTLDCVGRQALRRSTPGNARAKLGPKQGHHVSQILAAVRGHHKEGSIRVYLEPFPSGRPCA